MRPVQRMVRLGGAQTLEQPECRKRVACSGVRIVRRREQRCQINRDHTPIRKILLPGGGKVVPATQVDVGRVRSEFITNPAGPSRKVGIVAGKTECHQGVLHERLLHQIDQWGEAPWVGAKILLGEDERPHRGEAAVQLYDARLGLSREVLDAGHHAVGAVQHPAAGILEQGVVVGGEQVLPGEGEEQMMRLPRRVAFLRNQGGDKVVELLTPEHRLIFAAQPDARGDVGVCFRATELSAESARHILPDGEGKRTAAQAVGIAAETCSDQRRSAARAGRTAP